MSNISLLVVVWCSWWIFFYMLVPIGNKYSQENHIAGNNKSSPIKSYLGIKALLATVLAIIFSWWAKHNIMI